MMHSRSGAVRAQQHRCMRQMLLNRRNELQSASDTASAPAKNLTMRVTSRKNTADTAGACQANCWSCAAQTQTVRADPAGLLKVCDPQHGGTGKGLQYRFYRCGQQLSRLCMMRRPFPRTGMHATAAVQLGRIGARSLT